MPDSETKLQQVDRFTPEPAIIATAAALLQAGELVVFPTETVYGLGANAYDVRAVEKIFAAKGRPYSDPLIVHIAEKNELDALVTTIPDAAEKLIEAFWPGPLTIILPASTQVPGLITAGLPNVAVRMPQHPVARALIRAARKPIAAPSANRFMHVSPTTAQHAFNDLHNRVPLILDGGPCAVGVESTVVDLCAEQPTILRPGGVSMEDLCRILPDMQAPIVNKQLQAPVEEKYAQAAPGQMLIHYSPSVPTFLFEGAHQPMMQALQREIARRQAHNERVGVLISNEDLPALQATGADIYALGQTANEVATHLFAGLRTLEEAGVAVILCRSFHTEGLGLAIRDRLLKASGGKVIHVEA